MDKIDLSHFAKIENIKSIKQLVGVFNVELEGNFPFPLIVKVYKMYDQEETYFQHFMNYWVARKSESIDPSFERYKSIEDALNGALNHSLFSYNANIPLEELEIHPNPHFYEDLSLDNLLSFYKEFENYYKKIK